MIFIGIGSNLTSDNYNSKLDACRGSIELLRRNNIEISSQSSWYETLPIPASSQSNFINGVISVKTHLDSSYLLDLLLTIEAQMGRKRGVKNAARIIDLDLINQLPFSSVQGQVSSMKTNEKIQDLLDPTK